jgi:hypothetical protein
LVRGGAILHNGDYCHKLQATGSGEGVLPVINGCQFSLSQPNDLFATDGSHFSVSKVVGEAEVGVRGAPDATVIVACRLDPQALYWFWISADGDWNIDDARDVHHPRHLVAAALVDAMRKHIKEGALNQIAFKCDGGRSGTATTLALNLNGYQFAAVAAPPLSDGATATALSKPGLPWFIDIGARLASGGSLEATVANVRLYDSE